MKMSSLSLHDALPILGGYTGFTSTWIPTAPGSANKLQILLPGETAAPGTVTGKTGTPTPFIAGLSTRVIVNVVDANWKDRKSTRLNSSRLVISYAVFC